MWMLVFDLGFTEIRAFTLCEYFTRWCTCSPSKVTLLSASQREDGHCAAVCGYLSQVSLAKVPRHLSLWSSPRLGFLHVNRLWAGAQCMIILLVGGSDSCSLLRGAFSTYRSSLGQVFIKRYNQPLMVVVSEQACAWEFKSSVFNAIYTITCLLSAITV